MLVRNLRKSFAADVRISRRHHAPSRRNEAGSLRAHPARPRLRRCALSVASRHQHFTRGDRQRPHAGKPSRPPALTAAQRSPRSGSAAETSRHFPGLQRERGVAARAGGRDSRRVAEIAERAERELLREVRVAPTLVKYADPNPYEIETRRELQQAAAELMRGAAIEPAPLVDLVDDDAFEIESPPRLFTARVIIPTGRFARRSKRPARRAAAKSSISAFASWQPRRAAASLFRRAAVPFRHSHGHRRLPRHAPPSPLHPDHAGFHDSPRLRHAARSRSCRSPLRLRSRDEARGSRGAEASAAGGEEARQNAQYAIPFAFRKRTLFKMDFAEAVYISELRTTPAGHASYRNVAYAMYEAVAAKYPALAKYFRVHDVREPVDLLKR